MNQFQIMGKLWLALLLLIPLPVMADLQIDVQRSEAGGIPIAVVPFVWSGPARIDTLAEITEADLARSGFFETLRSSQMRAAAPGKFDWQGWRDTRAEFVVIGKVDVTGEGQLVLEYRLMDVLAGSTLRASQLQGPMRLARRLAHQVADAVHEEITGIPGVFSTRIAYISQSKTQAGVRYLLCVADVDGHNSIEVLTSPHPLMSPAWSPDARELAYVSFESGRPQVYVQHLRSGRRQAMPAPNSGSSSPAFSPDGRMLTFVKTVNDSPEIFLYRRDTREMRQVTFHPSIDTEPVWDADSAGLVFTSNRTGHPQLHHVRLDQGRPRPLPLKGSYNADADVSPDGRYLALVRQMEAGGFGVALYEPKTEVLLTLSTGGLDESPSFAPNGFSLLFASTNRRSEQVIVLASHDGRIHQRLAMRHKDVREPVWSPYHQ